MKNTHKRAAPRPADLILTACILLVCAVCFFFFTRGGGAVAVVTVDGETACEIDLKKVESPYEIALDCGVTIGVSPGEIRFTASDCRGGDCVRCGALRAPGQTAACLPNRVLITVTGRPSPASPDAIVY